MNNPNMTNTEVVEAIQQELLDRYPGSDDSHITDFIVRALSNYFTTDDLIGFYEFLKDE